MTIFAAMHYLFGAGIHERVHMTPSRGIEGRFFFPSTRICILCHFCLT